jgi:23S rRNA (uracil1939-C5)-methyltransferase
MMIHSFPAMETGTFEMTIEKLVAGGDGLGFRDGKAVFVPGVLPGERVSVEIVESRTDFSRAVLRGIVSPSPGRREPACALAGVCGGCNWLHMDYETQLEQKKAIALETLRRTGGISLETIDIEPGAPLGYRSRLQVHRGDDGALGFMGLRSHSVVPVERCPVAEPTAGRVFSAPPAVGADRFTVFGYAGSFACEGAPGAEEAAVEVSGARLVFSVRCFFQSNVPVLERLVAFLMGELGEAAWRGRAADLYCGVGVFGVHLAGTFDGVTAVESDKLSIQYAKRNIPRGKNKFYATPLENWVRMKESGVPFSAVVVDPPRTGLARKVREYLAASRPPVLVYVSCNPVTLSRDLVSLSESFTLKRLKLFDFYPQTSHIEAAAVLIPK